MKNNVIVLSGPSGVGKGTIANLLKARTDIKVSISCTTRSPRNGEINGKDYFFITKEEFLDKIKNDGFLEYSEHFGNYYGTPKDYVSKTLETNDVLLEIDVNGGTLVKEKEPNAKLIFLAPPSETELRNRLTKRNTESQEKIDERLSRLSYELSLKEKYDFVVINDDLEETYKKISTIINNLKGE